MPKVSVIVAVYNAIEYIKDSLDSLSDQTFQDFEIILVDDCSNDGTEVILQEYADTHDNTTLIKNSQNSGCYYGRNRALIKAKGEYIAIHDADDISLPKRFEKEVRFLDENKHISIVGSFALRISQTGEEIGSMVYPPLDTSGAFAVITRYKLNPIIDPSSMCRRKVILKHGGYSMEHSLRCAADFELWCRLLCHGHLIANIPETLIKYRINPKGMTRTKTKTMVDATDVVWASFRRKSFSDPILSTELFGQDIPGDS